MQLIIKPDEKEEWKTARQWALEGRIVSKNAVYAINRDDSPMESKDVEHNPLWDTVKRRKYYHFSQTKKPSREEIVTALASYRLYLEAQENLKMLVEQNVELIQKAVIINGKYMMIEKKCTQLVQENFDLRIKLEKRQRRIRDLEKKIMSIEADQKQIDQGNASSI